MFCILCIAYFEASKSVCLQNYFFNIFYVNYTIATQFSEIISTFTIQYIHSTLASLTSVSAYLCHPTASPSYLQDMQKQRNFYELYANLARTCWPAAATATGHGHKPAKDKFGANYKCRQRQKWLAWIGSDQGGAERSGVEWSGSPSIGGRTAKCCCRRCHSLACQRAWQWELPHRMAFMNESQNTHTKLWAKSQTQSCVHSMSESEFESESEYVIWICFFVWLFVCLSFFAVCGFGDLAICKVWN